MYSLKLLVVRKVPAATLPLRLISTTPVHHFDQKWREARGLPMNPNAYGILTDSPDYSFLDGRSTPYGVRQRKRIVKHREIAEAVIKLTKEVDFAVERHKSLLAEEDNGKKQIIDSKLKAKGTLLLRKK